MKKIIFILCFVFILSACVSEHMPPEPKKGDPSSVKLAEAAVAVSSSIQTLEGIRKTEFPSFKKELVDPNASGMNFYASVDWVGPIGPLVERLANASGYRLRVLGTPPAIPIIVSLYEKDTRIAELLRDADFQAGTKANIVVYPNSNIVELRYNRS
ncbi:MAG: type IVB secretion system lipoprotein DotD [Gammaproteobacteria bacterium]